MTTAEVATAMMMTIGMVGSPVLAVGAELVDEVAAFEPFRVMVDVFEPLVDMA